MANTPTKIDWNSAVTKKHIKEAEAADLTLLGVGRNRWCRTYSFDKCVHEQEIYITTVRKKEVICHRCLQDKHNEEAKAAGLTLLGVGGHRHYRTYRFDLCGHEQEIDLKSVRLKTFICHQCLQNKLNSEAKAAGLTLRGAGRDSQYRTYRFDQCGHEQEFTTGNVRALRARCENCQLDKHNEEAKAVGLTLVGAGRKNSRRAYRINECGHEQEIETGAVRINNFVCNACEETARDLPSNVYLLRITVDTVAQSDAWLKLGYAKTVSSRIQKYGLPSAAVIKRLKMMNFATGRQAHRFEASLHTKYLSKRLPPKKMKKFHAQSGGSECYPIEMLDTLIKDLEAKEKRMNKK